MTCVRWASLAILMASLASTAAAGPLQAVSHSETVPVHVAITSDIVPVMGQQAEFTATVTADRELPNIVVKIEIPENGKPLRVSEKSLGKLSKGQRASFSARASFAKSGTKLIRVVALAEERPGVVWSAVAYLPMYVGSASSHPGLGPDALVTDVEQTVPGDGVLRGRPSKSSADAVTSERPPALQTDQRQPLAGAVPDGTLVVTGAWQFSDRSDVLTGQRQTVVELRRGSDGAHLAWEYTDWNGNFTFPAVTNPGTAGVYVRCITFTDQGDLNITSVTIPGGDLWTNAYTADSSVSTFADGTHSIGTWIVTNGSTNEKAWWIKDDMIKAMNTPPNLSGQHVAEWSPTSTDGAYYGGGRMHLAAGDADNTPDTVLHEMGHSVMHNIYGGYSPPNPNCDPHTLMGSSSTGCAWTEGWAQVWHMWTTNDAIRHYPGGGWIDLENATWGDGYDEGDTVEGRVAGAIWDITDAAVDLYDKYDGAWEDVWDVMWNVNCDTFADFWAQWKARLHPTHGPVGSIYQSTIDYNTAPTFAGLPDRTTVEDTPFPDAIALHDYAFDPESSDSELYYEVYYVEHEECGASIDSGHRVDISPALNWNGTSLVTICCSDGIRSRYAQFTVAVTPVNDPPVLAELGDRTLPEDSISDNAIDLWTFASDPDNTDAELTFQIIANTNPQCGVSIDSNRYVDIHPVDHWYGSSTVSIQATDPGGLAVAQIFTIYVNSVNDAPVIAGIPNRSLNEDTSLNDTIDLWAYASDVETPDANLSFSIVGNSDPGCGVSIDGDRYIDINPDPDWWGTSDVTIRVRDIGGLTAQDTFQIKVIGINDPPTISDLPDVMVQTTVGGNDVFDLDSFAADLESADASLTFSIVSSSNPSAGVTIDAGHCVDVNPTALWTGYSDVVVRVTDPGGLWAEDTFRVVVANLYPTVADARDNPDGTWVGVNQRFVSATFPTVFYIQDPGRASGIGVAYTGGPAVNTQVKVAGPLSTSFAERRITPYLLQEMGASPPVRPLGMPNGTMGGAAPDASTLAVPPEAKQLYNVGLLVRTTGQVTYHISTTAFYIWDGSSVIDSRPTTLEPWLRVNVPPSGWRPPVGSHVSVTGISGAGTLSGKTMRVLKPRGDDDILINAMRVAYVYRTNYSEALLFKSLLDANALPTQIVSFAQLDKVDWSPYHVIIIGNDTGPWDDTSEKYVTSSGKPVIAVGAGGVLYLEEVTSPADLYLGTTNSIPVTSQQYARIAGGDIYAYPYALPSTPGTTIQVVTSPGIYAASLSDPTGVTSRMLGQYTDSTRYVLAGELSRFYQWGFYGQPDKMTEQGKQLFVNLVFRSVRP